VTQTVADATSTPGPVPRALLIGVLGGFVLRLAFIWSGLCDGNVIADDAYYYFTIAHNLAAGAGPTFDGISWTNGFHPLYELILVPIFSVARAFHASSWMPIHVALTCCALFDALTALVLAAVLRRLAYPAGGVIAAWLWSLSPPSVLATLRGLEGAVSALAVSVTLLLLVHPHGIWERPGRAFRLGLAIGLAFLARTDNGPFLAASLMFYMAFDLAARRRALPEVPNIMSAVAGTCAGAALVGLPWLTWNLTSFGSLVQVSGLAKLHNKEIFGALHGLQGLRDVIGLLARPGVAIVLVSQYVAGEDQAEPHLTPLLMSLIVFGLAFVALLVRRAWMTPRSTFERPLLAFVAVFLMVHCSVYGYILGTYMVWYATIPMLLATLVAGGIAWERMAVEMPPPARWTTCVALVLLSLAVYTNFFTHVSHGPRRREIEAESDLRTIQSRFPGVRSIGGFNVGALGYFATTRGQPRVVNLDGLVNNALYEAWRQDRVLAYLERNVDLIVMDAPETMRGWLRAGQWERLTVLYPQQDGSGVFGPRRNAHALPGATAPGP
jgi:hypothetical protein